MSEYYAALVRRYIHGVWHPGETTFPKQAEIEKILLTASSLSSQPTRFEFKPDPKATP